MVEGARLESVFRGNSNVGSNPTLSAILESITYNGKRAMGACYCNLQLRFQVTFSPALNRCNRGCLRTEDQARRSGTECPLR